MWVCNKCNEEIEDNFDSCWNCTTESDIIEKHSEEPNLTTLLEKENEKIRNDEEKLKKLFEEKFPENIRVKTSYGGGLTIVYNFFISVKIIYLDPLTVKFHHTIFTTLFGDSLLGQFFGSLLGKKEFENEVLKFIYKEWFKLKEEDWKYHLH